MYGEDVLMRIFGGLPGGTIDASEIQSRRFRVLENRYPDSRAWSLFLITISNKPRILYFYFIYIYIYFLVNQSRIQI